MLEHCPAHVVQFESFAVGRRETGGDSRNNKYDNESGDTLHAHLATLPHLPVGFKYIFVSGYDYSNKN